MLRNIINHLSKDRLFENTFLYLHISLQRSVHTCASFECLLITCIRVPDKTTPATQHASSNLGKGQYLGIGRELTFEYMYLCMSGSKSICNKVLNTYICAYIFVHSIYDLNNVCYHSDL